MNKSFNLLEAPWLPCIDKGNRLVHLNLNEIITKAHQLKEIQADITITTASLYLFLIAYVMNILKLSNEDNWESIWKNGFFPTEIFAEYSVKWKSRFDLFNSEKPFYQDPKIGTREKDIKNLKKGKLPEPKVVSGLLLHIASGSNATLFDHSLDVSPNSYTAKEIAQILIMLQAYSLGGMSSASIAKDKYYKDSPFGRGILFLNRGNNLFETLLLNIPTLDFNALTNKKNDRPSWEQDDPFSKDRHDPNGLLDFLTWQSRRILLIPEVENGEIHVSSFFTAPGHGLVETFSNPYYQNRIDQTDKKLSIKPLRFQINRSLWRDSAAILDVKSDYTSSPIPIQWSAHLKSIQILQDEFVNLELFGMCTQPGQKKAYFYAHEAFTAPIAYLENKYLLEQLQNGLNYAERARSNLYISVRELARFKIVPLHDLENVRVPGRDDTDPLMRHWNAEYQYWSKLEPSFYEYLANLPKTEQAHDSWETAICQAARDALKYAADQVSTDPAGLKARAKAEKTLNYLLHKTFHPPEKE